MRVQEKRIVPAVVMAFELQKFGSARVRTRQAERKHGRFAAGVGKSHSLGRRDHATETLCSFNFRGCRGGKV